jgi:hypothetical protein
MALQRTRRPRFRSGRSLRSLGSPLNARPLGHPKSQAVVIAARFFGVAAAISLIPSALSGCQCGNAVSPSEALMKSAAVFEGVVVKIKEPASSSGGSTDSEELSFEKMVIDRGRRIHFSLTRSWKSALPSEPVVLTLHGGPDCGHPFAVGKPYLVWARGLSGRRLMTDVCTRTRPHAEASSDLAFLNRARGGK